MILPSSSSDFNPTDKKYQVSDQFPPDKESTYHYPPSNDGWVKAHNCIRHQIDEFYKCLVAVRDFNNKSKNNELLEWQVVAFQRVFGLHEKMIHGHHETEDRLAVDFLKRFHYPDKLTDDHDGLIKQLDKVSSMVKALKPGDDTKTAIGALLVEFERYRDDILPHLQEEEDYGLPLARAYFDQKTYSKLVKTTLAKHKFDALLEGGMVYVATADGWKQFMKQEGIPFFVWYMVFGPCLRAYKRKIVPQVTALMSGVEPPAESKKWFFSC